MRAAATTAEEIGSRPSMVVREEGVESGRGGTISYAPRANALPQLGLEGLDRPVVDPPSGSTAGDARRVAGHQASSRNRVRVIRQVRERLPGHASMVAVAPTVTPRSR
jgi:hypothetical protein